MEHDTPLMISAGGGENAYWLSSLALEHHRRSAKDGQARRTMDAQWVRLLQGLGVFHRVITRAVASVLRGSRSQSILRSPNKKNHADLH